MTLKVIGAGLGRTGTLGFNTALERTGSGPCCHIERFQQHIDAARNTMPASRLLAFEVKDGWETLCEFRQRPQTAGGFPFVNDEQETKTMVSFASKHPEPTCH